MPEPWVVPLVSSAASPQQLGGKGFALWRLVGQGLAVPPAFVVTTAAYNAFLARGGLAQEIVAALRGRNLERPADCGAVAAAVRAHFISDHLPAEVAAAIRCAHRDLVRATGDETPLAVRSSATAEDLASASFAGQQETVLAVRGEAGVRSAVMRCWAGLWSERALAYSARLGVDPVQVQLAVVVQVLVPAETAGVLFTADPLTGARDRVVINAVHGLGESLVAGRVTPETVVLNKHTGRILSVLPGDQSTMLVAGPAGTESVAVPPRRRSQPVLAPEHAAELASVGGRLQEAFGLPQDIEWAVARGRVWMLQSRPITVAPRPPAGSEALDDWPEPVHRSPHPFDLWTRLDVGERWPEPVTPLTWTFYAPLDDAVFRGAFRDLRGAALDRIQWTRRFCGRVYLNEGALVHVCEAAYGMPPAIGRAVLAGDVPAAGAPPGRWRLSRLLLRLPGAVWLTGQRLLAERGFARLFPEIDAWVGRFQTRDLGESLDRALWCELTEVWAPRCARAFQMHADISIHAAMAAGILDGFVRRCATPRPTTQELLSGLSGMLSAEVPADLWVLAAALASLPPPQVRGSARDLLAQLRAMPAARAWLEEFEAFLARHGHRCANEAELLQPRWSEAPEDVLEAVLGFQRTGGSDPSVGAQRQRRAQAEAAAAAASGLPPGLRAPFRAVLGRTQRLVRLRDNGQHHVVQLLLPVRRILAHLGARWADRAWLARADDVFFLAMEEIARTVDAGSPQAAGVDLRGIVAGRRATYARWSGTAAPDAVGPDGRGLAPASEAAGGRYLTGVAASAGRARGPARVVASLSEALALPPGSILVTRATDPGWTPAFPVLGGLVLEIGGTLSHGAIVAREYGLPAVVGVPRATERIRDGQVVTVDGGAGRVELEAPRGQEPAPGGLPTG